ncbi:TRAP-type C4-dicarboxylate transport system, small permease component [Bhargavaea ginsengi]|uniref:TRAP-type C4-dicarboxylate transport system, small permease component n=1 Tax=Bhargavaea ginsengi TaxID=426757 RepID=A0A1H6U3D3_9BACL|nr:TRAP transporter small permease [Bhargavaea ginsengi]SEI86829.1 TRAP-type C4-dicarboxylate transport system, small permease component [Bhargavaea ginsengi]
MEKLATILAKILSYLCIIALALLSAIVLIQVVSRFFDVSLPATEELARLLIVWLTFLGSALAIHEKMHLGVRYFVNLASERYQRIIDTFIYALVAVLLAILVFYGFSLSVTAITTASATMRLPMAVFYLAIPVSSLFALYFIIVHILKPNQAEQKEASL